VSRIEILGAWLRLWTPPRGEVVPPVPWRAIAIGTVALVAVLGAAAALVLPGVSADRREAREREARAEAARHAAFLASVEREQRPHVHVARPAQTVAARRAMVAAASSGIARDARHRTTKKILGVECDVFPRTVGGTDPVADLARPAGAYDCVAVTARLPGGGIIGMNFRLVARFEQGRYAWCRTIPLGDEDRLTHPLPNACRLIGS
jgi:type II secretory pathway pseudopilin PulG